MSLIKKLIRASIGFIYFYFYKKYTNNKGNRVILYHSIGSKLKHDTYGISITKERFEEHLIFLKENYEIICIDENYHPNLSRKTLTITFDDGYKDNLIALELCEKYKIPFVLYITTGMIGEEQYLNEDEIKLFHKSPFCTLGTHSVTHPHLEELSYEEQYKELNDSKLVLESIIGEEVTHMSYPHGSFNENTLKIVEELKYKFIGSSEIGINTQNNLDYRYIRRIEIVASDDLIELQRKAEGYYDYLSLKNRIK